MKEAQPGSLISPSAINGRVQANLRSDDIDSSEVNIPDQSSMQENNEEEYFTFKNGGVSSNPTRQRMNINAVGDNSNNDLLSERRQSRDYIAKLEQVNCSFSALDRLVRPRKYKPIFFKSFLFLIFLLKYSRFEMGEARECSA